MHGLQAIIWSITQTNQVVRFDQTSTTRVIFSPTTYHSTIQTQEAVGKRKAIGKRSILEKNTKNIYCSRFEIIFANLENYLQTVNLH
jgi:hypothetical protein